MLSIYLEDIQPLNGAYCAYDTYFAQAILQALLLAH